MYTVFWKEATYITIHRLAVLLYHFVSSRLLRCIVKLSVHLPLSYHYFLTFHYVFALQAGSAYDASWVFIVLVLMLHSASIFPDANPSASP